MKILFCRRSSQVAPMKKASHINIVTLTPGYADIKAERATFKNVDSTWRVITHTFSAEQVLRPCSFPKLLLLGRTFAALLRPLYRGRN